MLSRYMRARPVDPRPSTLAPASEGDIREATADMTAASLPSSMASLSPTSPTSSGGGLDSLASNAAATSPCCGGSANGARAGATGAPRASCSSSSTASPLRTRSSCTILMRFCMELCSPSWEGLHVRNLPSSLRTASMVVQELRTCNHRGSCWKTSRRTVSITSRSLPMRSQPSAAKTRTNEARSPRTASWRPSRTPSTIFIKSASRAFFRAEPSCASSTRSAASSILCCAASKSASENAALAWCFFRKTPLCCWRKRQMLS
mmetsp:Transcript_101037/g.253362  ORF Transcript_101037/g.253362 Transcript_101037/m.253362 type:complete len:262 (+) Transcript_101037:453-1238(+)